LVRGFASARPRTLGRGGPRTGRDDATAEGEALALDLDRVGRDEPALAEEHVDAEVAETPDAVGLREVGPQPAHAPHGCAEVSRARHRRRAEGRRGVLRLVPGASGPDKGLRRDAADVEAVAAHQVPLDQRHPSPEPGGDGGAHQTRGARPNDHQVVAVLRSGLRPAGRVDVGHELPVMLVERLDPEPVYRINARHDRHR
jgi:hypothetical protein